MKITIDINQEQYDFICRAVDAYFFTIGDVLDIYALHDYNTIYLEFINQIPVDDSDKLVDNNE